MGKDRKLFGPACKDYEEDLVLYYYGDCADAERERVEVHLGQCASCSRFLADLRAFLPGMAEPRQFAQSFWDDYYRELTEKLALQERRNSWWRGFFAPTRFRWLPALGAAAVVMIALTFIFDRGGVGLQQMPSRDQVPQEILADAAKLDFFKSMDLLESLQRLEEMEGKKPVSDALHRL